MGVLPWVLPPPSLQSLTQSSQGGPAAALGTAAVLLTRTPPSAWWSGAVGNFSLMDWGIFAGLTGISLPLGYAAGASPSPAFAKVSGNMARPSMVAGAVMGAAAGFLLAYQNSCGADRGCCGVWWWWWWWPAGGSGHAALLPPAAAVAMEWEAQGRPRC